MELIVECFNRDPDKSAVPTVFRFAGVKDSREAWERLAWVATIVDGEKWVITSSLDTVR